MQDFASNHIIPYMEQKIRVLNQQVCSKLFLPFSNISFVIFGIVLGSHNKKRL
jgi:hypothetical protein